MKKSVQYVLLGALIGLSTSYIIITIILLQNPTQVINGSDLLLGCILAIALGVGCGLISLIFYVDDDEMYNNPNLHSEEQDDLEIPDGKII